MTIEINDKTIGIWHVELGGANWMAALQREADEKIKLTYRFRYYVDDEAFGSDDKKSWYEATTDIGEQAAIEAIRKMAEKLSATSRAPNPAIDEVLANGDPEDFIKRVLILPCMRMAQEGNA
jgi:hypothetical protein